MYSFLFFCMPARVIRRGRIRICPGIRNTLPSGDLSISSSLLLSSVYRCTLPASQEWVGWPPLPPTTTTNMIRAIEPRWSALSPSHTKICVFSPPPFCLNVVVHLCLLTWTPFDFINKKLEAQAVTWIRKRCNVDPDPGSANYMDPNPES